MRRGLSCGAALWAGLSGAEAAWASGGEGEAGLRGMGRFAGEGKGPVGEGEWAGLRWVWVRVRFSIYSISIYSLFPNLIQTKFEFKYKFEFKPHSNK